MTNEKIILNASIKLMEDGVLEPTDQQVTIETDNGVKTFNLPEPIHTFATWKDMGYIVKKGEHAIAKINIWRFAETKNDDGEIETDTTQAYKKQAFFFKKSQVELIKSGAN